jgi:hypothetical protein
MVVLLLACVLLGGLTGRDWGLSAGSYWLAFTSLCFGWLMTDRIPRGLARLSGLPAGEVRARWCSNAPYLVPFVVLAGGASYLFGWSATSSFATTAWLVVYVRTVSGLKLESKLREFLASMLGSIAMTLLWSGQLTIGVVLWNVVSS